MADALSTVGYLLRLTPWPGGGRSPTAEPDSSNCRRAFLSSPRSRSSSLSNAARGAGKPDRKERVGSAATTAAGWHLNPRSLGPWSSWLESSSSRMTSRLRRISRSDAMG